MSNVKISAKKRLSGSQPNLLKFYLSVKCKSRGFFHRSPKKCEKASISELKAKTKVNSDNSSPQANDKEENKNEEMEKEDESVEERNDLVKENSPDNKTPRRWLIPISKIIVCASGFANSTKEQIKESVTQLGGTFHYDFTSDVTVLITIDNKSDKYKVARKSDIKTVTASWLKESIKHDYFVHPEDYLFPIFFHHKFHFYDCETKELVAKVRKYRAEVVIDIDASMAKDLYIVIPNHKISEYIEELEREYSFFTSAFENGALTLITAPWIDSYINKCYGKVEKYTITYKDYVKMYKKNKPVPVRTKKTSIENSKTNQPETKVLQKFIKNPDVNVDEYIDKLYQEPDFKKSFFMADVNMCMYNVHSKEDSNIVTRVANACGAFMYDSFIPGITTHIVTQLPDKQLLRNMVNPNSSSSSNLNFNDLLSKAGSLDNSSSPYIVTKQWLIDSVISGHKEDEKYYLPGNMEQLTGS